MFHRKAAKTHMEVTAPMTGRAIPLEQVPDPVFSDRILGDGLAIFPEEGTVFSPVSGEVSSVAETGHAYGFHSDDGWRSWSMWGWIR